MAKNNKDSEQKRLILEGAIMEKPEGAKCISYSQYSVYKNCPHQWELKYKNKLFPFSSSVDTVFGTSLHETLQHWLTILHNDSVRAAEEFSFEDYLLERMVFNYNKEKEANDGQHFIQRELLMEYYEDGCLILNYLRKKRGLLFDYRQQELLAVELPLYVQIMDDYPVLFNAFIDLLFFDKSSGTYEMPDIKTSKNGWRAGGYEMKSQLKMDQVLLYKHYLSKHYNIPVENINGKFLIVKRKVGQFDGFDLPRHLMHIPAQGTAKMKLAVANLEGFVKDVFNPDGSYVEKTYYKTPSQSACRFCPFAGKECNMEAD